MQTITTRDMTDVVKRALGTYADEHDVEAIVDEIHAAHGLVDVDTLDSEYFWDVVERHAK